MVRPNVNSNIVFCICYPCSSFMSGQVWKQFFLVQWFLEVFLRGIFQVDGFRCLFRLFALPGQRVCWSLAISSSMPSYRSGILRFLLYLGQFCFLLSFW